MKLEEYLKALRKCPDREETIKVGRFKGRRMNLLASKYGIYDNFEILFNADFDTVVRDVIASTSNSPLFTRKYVPASSELQKMCGKPYIPGISDSDIKRKRTDVELVDGVVAVQLRNSPSQRNQREYNVAVSFHPVLSRQVPGISDSRVMAWVIEDFCNYALNRKIPLCLTNPMGFRNRDDVSKVIYHP